MPDQLNESARKAADRIADAIFPQLREGKCDSNCDDCTAHFECKVTEEITTELITGIIKGSIRESVVSYQKVIECAVRYIAQQQQCPPNYLRSSLCLESVSCEKCWCEWLANTAMKHEEASQCQD